MPALAAPPQPSAKLQPADRDLICGCIDIGTNTTRLLVAQIDDGLFSMQSSERAFTHLGACVEPDGTIPAAKVEEIAVTVGRLADSARASRCDRVVVLGTAVLRNAPNADAVTAAVNSAAGCDLVVIDGEQEARLTFAGATYGLGSAEAQVAVVDVGGGSTEMAVGRAGHEADWWCSLPVGSSITTEECVRSDPPSDAEIGALRERVRAVLDGVDPPAADRAIAVGNTAISIVRMVGKSVTPAAFERTLDLLTAMPRAEAGKHFAIDPARVRLLPAALLILGGISERFGLELVLGGGGLREGAVLALAEGRL